MHKIIITGNAGSGKTTLSKRLSNFYDGTYIPEIVRPKTKSYNNEFYLQNDILKYQVVNKSDRILSFMDRNFFSTLAFNYSDDHISNTNNYGSVVDWLKLQKKQGKVCEPDIYLYLDLNVKQSLDRQNKSNEETMWMNRDFLIHLRQFYINNLKKISKDNKTSVYTLNATNSFKDLLDNVKYIIQKEIRDRYYHLILFDLDGTIIDTSELTACSFQHAFRSLNDKSISRKKILKNQGVKFETVVKKLFPNNNAGEVEKLVVDYEFKNYKKHLKLFKGIKSVLDELKKLDFKLGLVTSRGPKTSSLYLSNTDLNKYFEVIINSEDTKKGKPHPDPILLALKKMNIEKNKAIIIGDSPADIISARKAGIKSVAVTWGFYSESELKSSNPNLIINRSQDILKVIKIIQP